MRRDGRREKGCTEAYLEVCRVFKDLCGKLTGWNGPDGERKGGNMYLFGCTIFEEVEGARRSDDGSVTERCRTN
jgi:hypothetical protein